MDLLEPETYISLAIAYYPLFQRRSLVPRLTHLRLAHLTLGATRHYPLRLLPTELLLQVMRALPRRDMMGFVLADYRHLVDIGIAPQLTIEDVRCLRLTVVQ